MKRKCLTVEIILLFIGLAVALSIHFTTVNATSIDNQEERITQKDLLFQTIVNVANNRTSKKEIHFND